MNEAAREELAAASLRGHPQIQGSYHSRDNELGECAMGVLHLALHLTREEALECWDRADVACEDLMRARYGLRSMGLPLHCGCEYGTSCMSDFSGITHLNDGHDLTFLDIARKMPALDVG